VNFENELKNGKKSIETIHNRDHKMSTNVWSGKSLKIREHISFDEGIFIYFNITNAMH